MRQAQSLILSSYNPGVHADILKPIHALQHLESVDYLTTSRRAHRRLAWAKCSQCAEPQASLGALAPEALVRRGPCFP